MLDNFLVYAIFPAGQMVGPGTMNIAQFVEKHGTQPVLEHGRWQQWTKAGWFELTSLNNLHVLPHLWDPVAGLALVETKDGQAKLVRVENLRKYQRIGKDPVQRTSKPRKPKVQVSTKLDHQQLLAEILADINK